MAPPHTSHQPPTANPSRKIFDPWNSSSTGHQQCTDNRLAGSTSWRASRTMKLAQQFKAGPGGGDRLYDSVGAGSEDFGQDGRKGNGGWDKGAPGLREKGWQDIRELLGDGKPSASTQQKLAPAPRTQEDAKCPSDKKIFRDLCVYINGSTAPLVSDHKLKQLLAQNGARISIALGRRNVTHVVLGTPNGHTGGAGGGLAAGKIQKEIRRIGGCGVKYVGVEWVLESIRAGKRLSETRFSNMSIAPKNQKSVYGMFKKPIHDPEASEAKDAT